MIHEKAHTERLGVALITGAIRDLLFGDALQQVMAIEFLTSPDLDFWLQLANFPREKLNLQKIWQDPNKIRKQLDPTYKEGRKHGKRRF